MLQEIAKQDHKWREIAFNICKDKTQADDLTQEMYLRIHKYKKNIDPKERVWFITTILLNIFRDGKRKKNVTVDIECFYNLETNDSKFEPNDYELEILERINKLPWIQKELLGESYDRSLRYIDKEYEINYGFVHRQITEAKKTVLDG